MATTTEISDREEIYRAALERRRPDADAAQRVRNRVRPIKDALGRRAKSDLAVPLIRRAREE